MTNAVGERVRDLRRWVREESVSTVDWIPPRSPAGRGRCYYNRAVDNLSKHTTERAPGITLNTRFRRIVSHTERNRQSR